MKSSLLSLLAIIVALAATAQETAQIIPDVPSVKSHQIGLFGGQDMGGLMVKNFQNSHPVMGINYRYNLGECSSKCASQCCLTKLVSTHVRLNAQYLPQVKTVSEMYPESEEFYQSAEGYRVNVNLGVSLKNPPKKWMRNIAFEWGVSLQSLTKSYPVNGIAGIEMVTRKHTGFGPSMALYFPLFHSNTIGIDAAGHAHAFKYDSSIQVPLTLGVNAAIKL